MEKIFIFSQNFKNGTKEQKNNYILSQSTEEYPDLYAKRRSGMNSLLICSRFLKDKNKD